MKTRPRRKKPELVLRDGKPAAVILELGYYQEMLERLEDLEDLRELQAMRKKPLKFRRLEDFLREHGHRVPPPTPSGGSLPMSGGSRTIRVRQAAGSLSGRRVIGASA